MCGLAYFILAKMLTRNHGKDSKLAKAIGKGYKEMTSLALYTVAVPASFIHPWIACALYVAVAVMWFLPDRRIGKVMAD